MIALDNHGGKNADNVDVDIKIEDEDRSSIVNELRRGNIRLKTLLFGRRYRI